MNRKQGAWLMQWKRICFILLLLAITATGSFGFRSDVAQARDSVSLDARSEMPDLTSSGAGGAANSPQRGVAQQSPLDLLTLPDLVRQLGPELPRLLGMDQPRTYLVLVQNNHELRATGGFIAAVGRVTLEQGKITELEFSDSYAIFRQGVRYPPPPAPMERYMNIPMLVMRDANWSPDFPTSARMAQALYKSDTGIHVDGILTVDLNAVKRIFSALGQIEIEGFDEPITGENVEAQIVQLWERPAESQVSVGEAQGQDFREWWSKRKDFIPRLAAAVLDRLESGQVNVLRLAPAVLQALNERFIQIWLENPNAAAVLHARGWDGALRPAQDSDFLAVIDTNMGYNKADAAIQRSLEYRVEWPDEADQPAQATLIITYTHTVDGEDPGCDLTPRYGDSYADLIERCYFDYVRVYVPRGSELIEATGVEPDSVETHRGERRTQVFTGYFILPPGEQHTVTFTYTLPPALTPETYRLVLQRQSGTQPLPITVTVGDAVRSATVSGALWEWPAGESERR
ncbi:MAG: hypothetical protein KatS3mg049_0227 [Caldilinea sp.]|nr:MAG: hypothetical protein KatS3mg049_0227 [Caldilinea sp.]